MERGAGKRAGRYERAGRCFDGVVCSTMKGIGGTPTPLE